MTDTTPVSKSVAKRLAVQNPVPPVPSREAVELLHVHYMSVDVWKLQKYARTLLAEVERLTEENVDMARIYGTIFDERDRYRATVVEQGAALAELETARDDNAKLIDLLKNSRLAMAVTMRGLALSVQSKLVAALASAQSSAPQYGDGWAQRQADAGRISQDEVESLQKWSDGILRPKS
jgi:methylmalonyl-CoA mutase N-terminal domain/subunit